MQAGGVISKFAIMLRPACFASEGLIAQVQMCAWAESLLADIASQTLLAWNSVLISSKIWLRLILGKRLAAFSMSLYSCATPAEAAMHRVLILGPCQITSKIYQPFWLLRNTHAVLSPLQQNQRLSVRPRCDQRQLPKKHLLMQHIDSEEFSCTPKSRRCMYAVCTLYVCALYVFWHMQGPQQQNTACRQQMLLGLSTILSNDSQPKRCIQESFGHCANCTFLAQTPIAVVLPQALLYHTPEACNQGCIAPDCKTQTMNEPVCILHLKLRIDLATPLHIACITGLTTQAFR